MSSTARDLGRLRALAVGASLRRHRKLERALAALRFVQYDPIRRPERAQDLILGQRVEGYRAGDLDRHYPGSELEEDYLYAYGVLDASLAALLHPRPDKSGSDRPYRPRGLPADVLAFVREQAPAHPKDVAAALGRSQAANDWGGISAATTRVLEELHYHGLVRVAARANGVKTYEPRSLVASDLPADERLRQLTLAMATLLAPIPEPSLRRAVGQLCAASGGLEAGRGKVVADLVAAGELEAEEVDGLRYLAPPGFLHGEPEAAPDGVRFLAPFDPVVWDRRRFEHLWGWAYRLEAYTPSKRRQFGYYALPMLWKGRIVGWVNAALTEAGRLDVESGFAGPSLRGRAFRRAFDLEAARLEAMLGLEAETKETRATPKTKARRAAVAGVAPGVL